MRATKTKPTCTDDASSFGLITEISFDEFRRPTSAKFTSEPNDPPGAMESAIRAALDFGSASEPIVVATGQTSIESSQPLSSYVETYIDNAFTASKPSDKTLESYRAAILLFIDIVGDKPLHRLTVSDQNRFEDVISRIPANRTKIATARELSIDQMMALDVPKLSPQSTKNIAQRTNNFLSWAFRREGSKPPFELMGNVRITTRSKTVHRRAFTDDELRTLFLPTTYALGRQRSPYMYWLPLIGLHTGMRINEIAQLELADIGSRDGIAYLHVTDDDVDEVEGRRAKRVKTNAGRRIIPIHTALLKLGLLDYARIVSQDGHNVLFPELIGGRDGPGQPASKYFARYCDRVGLRDPGLVFHSFRHGAVSRMRAAGIAKELRMVVVGHSATEDTHDGYGDIKNDFGLTDRKRAIQALDFNGILDYEALFTLRPSLNELQNSCMRSTARIRTVAPNDETSQSLSLKKY